jgi:hypothetical protein
MVSNALNYVSTNVSLTFFVAKKSEAMKLTDILWLKIKTLNHPQYIYIYIYIYNGVKTEMNLGRSKWWEAATTSERIFGLMPWSKL